MKIKGVLSIFLFPIILFILNGCTSATLTALIPTYTVQTVEPSLTSPPATIIPTETTIKPISTLGAEDAYMKLGDLLGNDPKCRLPCWLQITPGRSSFIDAQTQLTLFSGISRRLFIEPGANKWSTGFFTIPHPNENMVIEIRPSYLVSAAGNSISMTGFDTRAYRLKAGQYDGDVYGYAPYNDLLKAYTISGVLNQYGQPAQIYILASLRSDIWPDTPGYGDYFEIHLWYPDKGIFLAYKMSVERTGESYQFCPSKSLISGYLLEPSEFANYQNVLEGLHDNYKYFFSPSIYVKKPEDAFGMTAEKFFQIFQSPTDQCLETPISIWWP